MSLDHVGRASAPVSSPSRHVARRILRNPLTMGGMIIVLVVVGLGVFAPLLTRFDPQEMIVIDRMQPPGATYLFGTDNFGRDLFSRVLFGARTSLQVASMVVLASTVFGVLIGAIAGYYRRLDGPLMRVMDAMMAFPAILLALAIMAILGRSVFNVAIALTVVYTPAMARLVRSTVLAAKEYDYVEAIRALGGRDLRLLVGHVLPNSVSVIVVQATFICVYAILAEAGLSFLGMGIPLPTPTWGNIMENARSLVILQDKPWMWMPAAVATLITVLSINFVGDGLRDALDPQQII